MKRQLLSFFLGNHIIPDEQFGFLPGRSTLWQLLQVLEEWQQALDAGGTVHALFLDVAKAFDRVDHGHGLLLPKLHSVGLSQPALDWVSSYLAGRCIRTTVDNRISGVRPIFSDVPQGSVLGPLLFLIYFRDIPSAVSSSSAMFADDTLVYTVGCDCHENKPSAERACTVALDVSALSQWSKVWNTVFNAAKSNDMLISRRRSSSAAAPLTLDGVDIPRLSVARHLGFTLSDKLFWAEHVKALAMKVAPKVALLHWQAYRLCLPGFVISRCFVSMVRPILEYAGPAWTGCRVEDARALEKVQLRVARLVLRQEGASLSEAAVLERVGWPTLHGLEKEAAVSLPVLAAGARPGAAQTVSWCTAWGHSNCQRLCQHLQRSVLLIPCANLLILLFPLAPLASISNLSYPLVSLPGMLFLFLYNPLPLCLLFVVLLPPTLPLIVLFMACSVCCVVKETLCISFIQLLGNPSKTKYIE